MMQNKIYLNIIEHQKLIYKFKKKKIIKEICSRHCLKLSTKKKTLRRCSKDLKRLLKSIDSLHFLYIIFLAHPL